MNFVLEKEDKMISTFLRSIGPWKKHVIISGGFAPIIYKLYLANYKKGTPPVGTRDIDSIVPRNISDIDNKNLARHLLDAGFMPIFKDIDIPASEAYIKEIEGNELEIEFLTSSNIRGDKNKNVSIAGIVAQPLKYLELSLDNSIEFTTDLKETGLVVDPKIWIFHKGKEIIVNKNWLVENLQLKINEIDWKTVRLDIEPFLKPEDQKFLENWNKELFFSILKKSENFLL